MKNIVFLYKIVSNQKMQIKSLEHFKRLLIKQHKITKCFKLQADVIETTAMQAVHTYLQDYFPKLLGRFLGHLQLLKSKPIPEYLKDFIVDKKV